MRILAALFLTSLVILFYEVALEVTQADKAIYKFLTQGNKQNSSIAYVHNQ